MHKATSPAGGYWLVTADGTVTAFGSAVDYGGMNGHHLAKPIVNMIPTSDGKGYWLIAADGGVFAFGDAGFYGSNGDKPAAGDTVAGAGVPSTSVPSSPVPGSQGPAGPQGPQGPGGAQGPAGAQGPPGAGAYAYVYQDMSEYLFMGQAVSFDQTGPMSGFLHPGVGLIVPTSGFYSLSFTAAATSAHFAVAVDGSVQPSSNYASSAAVGASVTGSVILSLTAGQVVTLINSTGAAVTVSTPPGLGNPVAASLEIRQVG